jgi:hypothetical protein
MASIGWTYAYSSGYTDYYYYTISYSQSDVPYPSGSTNRTSTPASGYTGGPLTCNTNLTFSVNYSYRVTGNPVTQTGSFDINGSAPSCPSPPPSYPPAWSDNTLGAFQVATSYSDAVSATNMNYSGSYSVSVGSLPDGISLNTSTGALTGTPTTSGAYSFTLRASNAYGNVSQAFSGNVTVSDSYGKLKVMTSSSQSAAATNVKVLDSDGSTWLTATVKYTTDGTNWTTSS